MPATTDVLASPEEYLARERAEELHKHEYRDGEMVQMPGASFVHTRIVANVMFELQRQLRDGDCEAVELSSIGCRLALEEVYRKVDLTK